MQHKFLWVGHLDGGVEAEVMKRLVRRAKLLQETELRNKKRVGRETKKK